MIIIITSYGYPTAQQATPAHPPENNRSKWDDSFLSYIFNNQFFKNEYVPNYAA